MLQQEVARFRQQQLPDIDDSASDREPDQLVDDKVQATSATPLSGLTGFQYLQRRQYGPVRADLSAMYADVVAQQIPSTLKEKEFELGAMNKIFAAKWLNDKQVVFGTKCNQVRPTFFVM